MMPRPPARTPAQLVAHLQERRRLLVANQDHTAERLAAIDAAIDALRTGRRLEADPAELLPADDERWSA